MTICTSSVALTINSYIEICSGTKNPCRCFTRLSLAKLKRSRVPLVRLPPIFAPSRNNTNSNAGNEYFRCYSDKLGSAADDFR